MATVGNPYAALGLAQKTRRVRLQRETRSDFVRRSCFDINAPLTLPRRRLVVFRQWRVRTEFAAGSHQGECTIGDEDNAVAAIIEDNTSSIC